MGLLDWFSEINPEYGQQRTQAQLQKLKLAQLQSQQDAQGLLYGGVNGQGERTNPLQMPPGGFQYMTPANTMFAPPGASPQGVPATPQGLLDAGIPQDQAQGILGSLPTPEQYTARRQKLLAQADPDFAIKNAQALQSRQNSMEALHSLGLPPDIERTAQLEAFGLPKTAEALASNIKTPDQIKLVSNLANQIAMNGGPSSPAAKPYVSLLTNATQNIDLLKLNEEIQKDKDSSISFQQDPVTRQWVMTDKRNKSVIPISGTGEANAPWNNPGAQQQPGQPPGAAPAPGATPQAPQGFSNDYIKSLPQDQQQRLTQLPPMDQPIIAGILAGQTPPPPAGGRSPDIMAILQRQLRMAQFVQPNFNEQKWLVRNEVAQQRNDTKSPSTSGGQLNAAKTLIGHLGDMVDIGADLGNESVLGPGGNYVANAAGNNLPNAIGGDPALQAKLNNFRNHAQGAAGELVKITTGAEGSVSDREKYAKTFPEDANIQGLLGGAGGAASLMERRLQSQVDAYNKAFDTNETLQDWLGKENSATLGRLKGLTAEAQGGAKMTPSDVKMRLRGITTQAKQALIANPTLRDQFDAKYGPGSSKLVLGK